MVADLHMHTSFSDGTYSPEELAAHGKRCRLDAMSLTDHDTVEGCARMEIACRSHSIEFISGTELTADFNGDELHLLGYMIDINNPRLLLEIAKFQKGRQDRIREMVARLNAHKIPLKVEDVFKLANCRSPGRPHVGRALVQAGYCSGMDEAFERFLKKHRPAYVPKTKISAQQAIELVHAAGGFAVMAHPGLNRTDELIAHLVEAGLDGIECFHSKHSPSDVKRYLNYAAKYKLLVTGGSDCHGMSKGKPLIGSVKIPYEYVARMKEVKASKDASSPGIQPSATANSI